jgi:hypothetical protein
MESQCITFPDLVWFLYTNRLDSNTMRLKEIRGMARRLRIPMNGMRKTDLIRTIQRAENNMACYGTERVHCCQEKACLWRIDCSARARMKKALPVLDAWHLHRGKPRTRSIETISHQFLSKASRRQGTGNQETVKDYK